MHRTGYTSLKRQHLTASLTTGQNRHRVKSTGLGTVLGRLTSHFSHLSGGVLSEDGQIPIKCQGYVSFAFKSSPLTPQPARPLEAVQSVISHSNLVQRIKNHCSPRRFPTTRSYPSAQIRVQVTWSLSYSPDCTPSPRHLSSAGGSNVMSRAHSALLNSRLSDLTLV